LEIQESQKYGSASAWRWTKDNLIWHRRAAGRAAVQPWLGQHTARGLAPLLGMRAGKTARAL
ncbi:hypothetical protein DXO165_11510, partial [Xanthomonas oryzae pv. oryzae]